MTDDNDDRPDHVGTPADETPFDHWCICPVCVSWRNEVRQASRADDPTGLSDGQLDYYKAYADPEDDDQAMLTSF